MKEKLFYILNGNNGASYIINCSSWASLCSSLDFYKARFLISNILKFGFKILLFLYKSIFYRNLKTLSDIEILLQQTGKSNNSFNLDNNCSVLISSTRDKIIVNHHYEYFHKFAFGKSINSVKNERGVYELCDNNIKSFIVSRFFDEYEIPNKLYSFKLENNINNKILSTINIIDLCAMLIEFFTLSSIQMISIHEYMKIFSKQTQFLDENIISAKLSYYRNNSSVIPLGLVHRDFKPWNIVMMNKPLVFDFEESCLNALPLEDVFNYIIDPIIRYKSIAMVVNAIFSKNNISLYNSYLNELNINIEYEILLDLYLIERVFFWSNKKEFFTSNKYMSLLEYLDKVK